MTDFFSSLPDYVGKGLVQLIVVTVCGLLIGWITSTIFARRSEINAVEGALLKRKLDIYEELNSMLELWKGSVFVSSDSFQAAKKMLEKAALGLAFRSSSHLFSIFTDPGVLKEELTKMEKYIATKRIYFDEEVNVQSIRFVNYITTVRGLLTLFEEQFIDAKISLEFGPVKKAEALLTIQLGMVLQGELNEQIDKLVLQLKESIQSLSFAHRSETKHSYDYYNSPEEEIMRELKDAILFTKNQEISQLITASVATAMIGHAKKK